jgi:hypothetical protein
VETTRDAESRDQTVQTPPNPGACPSALARQTAEEVGIVEEIARWCLGPWGAFGHFPEMEMKQDLLDDGWVFDETDDAHETLASRADEGVHFANLLDQTSPVAAALFAECVVLLGRLRCCTVFASIRRRAGIPASNRQARCGAVSFMQRFGDGLNLNVHFHTLAPMSPAT